MYVSSSKIGTPPTPIPQARVPSPPDQRVGVHTRLRLRGWGVPIPTTGEKNLALCLFCVLLAWIQNVEKVSTS